MIHENKVFKIDIFKEGMPIQRYLEMYSNQIDRIKTNRTS